MSIRDESIKWWAEKTKAGEHVVATGQIPGRRRREFLAKQGFLSPAAKGYWILKRPEDALEDIFPSVYWQAVDKILSRFRDWSIRGRSALTILAGQEGPQSHLLVRTKEKTNWSVSLPLGFDISLTYDLSFDGRLVKKIGVGGRPLPVDVPERVLVDLPRLSDAADAANFLGGTDFRMRTLDAIYASKPRPVVFARLARMAREADRPDLAVGLEQTIQRYTHYQVVKRARDHAPAIERPKPVAPSWVLRQERQFREFERVLEKRLARRIAGLKKHPLRELVTRAGDHKRYDTYHSTTLEGYRITPEEVDALLSGLVPEERREDPGKYHEEIANRMAITGYSEAFDFTLEKVRADFGRPHVSEDLVKDLYYHLFKPSADAGIIDFLDLTRYRSAPAFIRGTTFVPSSHEKLPELMAGFESLVGRVEDPVVEAVLAHHWFVTIHPYGDGNGRTARLLMDYLLLSSGYQWVTIRVDQRTEYFDALKRGQVEGDIAPFGDFLLDMVKAAGRTTA